MKNNSIGKCVALTVLGFILLITGLVLTKLLPDAEGIMRRLPYICVGVGSGIFGGSLGTAIKKRLLKKDPNAAKQLEIDTNDERNIAISNKAKAKAFDLMLLVYGALMLSFALMPVDMFVMISFVAAYLFVIFSIVYYINKYHKEM